MDTDFHRLESLSVIICVYLWLFYYRLFMCNDFRLDEISQWGIKIYQSPKKFCFGIDAVLLADYAKDSIRKDQNIFDLGTGTGIIPLLMCAFNGDANYTAIEIQEESALMAEKSVEMNKFQDKIKIVTGDVKDVPSMFPSNCAKIVTSNPPYMINEHGKQNPSDYKAIARHEVLCDLDDVVKAASHLLASEGHFFMIHRPFRLSEIFVTLTRYKLEPKRMRLVYPHADEEPNLVLIEAVKGARSRITVEKPLIVRNSDGSYTDEINLIYGRKYIK